MKASNSIALRTGSINPRPRGGRLECWPSIHSDSGTGHAVDASAGRWLGLSKDGYLPHLIYPVPHKKVGKSPVWGREPFHQAYTWAIASESSALPQKTDHGSMARAPTHGKSTLDARFSFTEIAFPGGTEG